MADKTESKNAPVFFYVTGLLLCAYLTLMGAASVLKGNLLVAGVFTVLMMGVLHLLAFYLLKYKQEAESYQRNKIQREYILLGGYGLMFIVLSVFCFHYAELGFLKKEEYKKVCLKKLGTIDTLKLQYRRAVADSVSGLTTRVENAETNYFSAIKGYEHVAAAASRQTLETLLGKGTVEFDSRQAVITGQVNRALKSQIQLKQRKLALDTALSIKVTGYMADGGFIFNNWNFFKVSDKYYDIDKMYTELLAGIRTRIPGFVPQKPTGAAVELSNPFYSLFHASFGQIALILMLLLAIHFLILSSYIFYRREHAVLIDPRSTPLKNGDIKDYFLN